MKQDIYDLLNDIEIDLSELKREDFTEIEGRRVMKKFRRGIFKNRGYKKYAGAAAVLMISTGILGSIPTFATTNVMAHSIADFLGIEKNLESYTTVINKAITKGNITIQLNEVILNEKELTVSTTITSAEPFKTTNANAHADASIYVNGKQVAWAAGGASEQVDEYTVEELMHYQLEEVYTGELDMTIIFNGMRVDDAKQKGRWKFEFTTSGEELAVQTRSQEINQVYTLPNETQIILTRYAANDMGEKIYFTLSKAGADYDLELRGTDNLGNPIVFTLANQKETNGVLKLSDHFSVKDESASSYTLELYAVRFPEESGRLSNDFEKVGEAFSIILE